MKVLQNQTGLICPVESCFCFETVNLFPSDESRWRAIPSPSLPLYKFLHPQTSIPPPSVIDRSIYFTGLLDKAGDGERRRSWARDPSNGGAGSGFAARQGAGVPLGSFYPGRLLQIFSPRDSVFHSEVDPDGSVEQSRQWRSPSVDHRRQPLSAVRGTRLQADEEE